MDISRVYCVCHFLLEDTGIILVFKDHNIQQCVLTSSDEYVSM